MTTYNKEYYRNPARRKKQRYALMERVIDFSHKPMTDAIASKEGAWAANDVLETVPIRSGQTVLGVQVEILKTSTVSNARIKIGYGTDDDFWGVYDLDRTKTLAASVSTGYKSDGPAGGKHIEDIRNFGNPVYFSSSDTVDITMTKALTNGRVRLVVHLLEDDR